MFQPTRRMLTPRSLRLCTRCLSTPARSLPQRIPTPSHSRQTPQLRRNFTTSPPLRASISTASQILERIEELYDNATEEFTMAAEETEGNTVYAADDREAAKAEVGKLTEFYESVVNGEGHDVAVREEVKRRAGTRVRELANAMAALEERAMQHD